MYCESISKVIGDILCRGSPREGDFNSFMNLLDILCSLSSPEFASEDLSKGICFCVERFIRNEELLERHIGLIFTLVNVNKNISNEMAGRSGPGNLILFKAINENISNSTICKRGYRAIEVTASDDGIKRYHLYYYLILFL